MKAIVTISTEAKPALTLIYGYIEINLKRGWPLHVDLSQQSERNNTDPKPFKDITQHLILSVHVLNLVCESYF